MAACLLGGCAAGPLAHAQTPAAAARPAIESLQSHLGALKDVRTLSARFVCEKRLAMLESPLVSAGQLWIRKTDDKEGGGAVRFATSTPYTSDLILAEGKVQARSQHETEWTVTNQSTRPGLSAVMVQLGGWLAGDAGKLTDLFTVGYAPSGATIPAPPQVEGIDTRTIKAGSDGVETFVLTPSNKDLAVALKSIELVIDRPSHKLLSIAITTAQDDVTRYWFYDVQLNPTIPADTFKPGPGTAAPAPASGAGGSGRSNGGRERP
jgi:outer membrane lipoprotein-sorting protein